MLSRNEGGSWVSCDGGMPSNPKAMCVMTNGSVVYAGLETSGIYESNNFGSSWESKNSGLKMIKIFVSSLFSSDGVYYAGTDGAGVYVSHNNGFIWQPSNYGLNLKSRVKAFVKKDSLIFVATDNGIYFTKNKGDFWKHSTLPVKVVNDLAVCDSLLFAATENGVFITKNNGKNWVVKTSGLTNTSVNCLAVKKAKKKTYIFAGTNGGGVFVSENFGETWKYTSGPILQAANIYSISPIKKNVFIGTNIFCLMKSANNGKSWKKSKDGLPARLQARSVNFTSTKNYMLVGSTGFYYSKNKGKSWVESNIGMPMTDIYSLLITEEKIFAGGAKGYIYFQKSF